MADPYAVKLGVKVTHSALTTSYIHFPTGSYPLLAMNEGSDVVWEATAAGIYDADGGTIGESAISKEFSGEWTVWFNLPQGLLIEAFGGTVNSGPIFEGLVAWLYLYIEWSDSSVTEIGSLGPGGYAWEGQLPVSWISLEDPIDSTPDTVIEIWQRKTNTIEVNA